MNEEKKVYLTEEGIKELEQELDELKNVKRPEVIQALKEARALGDLSENAEYDAARTEQALVEGKIAEIEAMLEHAVVIKEKNTEFVNIGASVELKYVEDGETDNFTICGSKEVDPFNNKISNESPVAVAILNHRVGDIVTVESPNGKYDVEILAIS